MHSCPVTITVGQKVQKLHIKFGRKDFEKETLIQQLQLMHQMFQNIQILIGSSHSAEWEKRYECFDGDEKY